MSQAARLAHWVPTYSPAPGNVVVTTSAPNSNNVVDTAFGSAAGSGGVTDPTKVLKAGDTMTGVLTIQTSGGAPQINVNKTSGSGICQIAGSTNGSYRWATHLGTSDAEGGGNTGSNFALYGCNDDGSTFWQALVVNRQTKVVSIPQTIAATSPTTGALTVAGGLGVGGKVQATGYGTRAGVSGPHGGSAFNIEWNGGAHLWIDVTDLGVISTTSDYRTKKDIVDLPSTWQAVKALRPISYKHKPFKSLFTDDGIQRWGFIAHELQETLLPSAASGVKDALHAIQSPNTFAIIAALTKALQEAMARIEALETK